MISHGTGVAEAAVAISNNATGVAGVAWNNPIMPLVMFDSNGVGSWSAMIQAIIYAADHGVRVMNLSVGASSTTMSLQNAVDYAWNKGCVIVASAGNSSSSTLNYPAACNNVVAVSATDSSDLITSFSSYGDWIDISAPGIQIMTTSNTGSYYGGAGTSFSSPVAAGLAALVLSANPALTNAQVVSIMENNADDLGTPGFDIYYGYGRINVYKSVLAAKNTKGEMDALPPTVSITSPTYNATVSGITTVNTSATNNAGVSKVELYVGGTLFAADTAAPYDFSWDTTKYPDGSYNLESRAYDASGNVGVSGPVQVTVSNPEDTVPPVVTITSPANNAYVANSQKITVTASDNVSVSKMELYIDNALKSTVTNQNILSYTWNMRKVASGAHNITAKAYDAAGNMNINSITVYK